MFSLKSLVTGMSLVVSASAAVAQQVNIDPAEIRRIMIDDTRFGGCAAVVSPSPHTLAQTCAENWVTFDCFASLGAAGSTKAGARDKLQAAQLAMVTKTQAIIRIDPDVTANGATCYAVTVQNLPNSVN